MASYLDNTGLAYLWGKITSALSGKADTSDIPTTLADLSADSTHRVVTDAEKATWNGKQDALTWDTTPTQNSTNGVTSGGLYNVIGDIETLINAL